MHAAQVVPAGRCVLHDAILGRAEGVEVLARTFDLLVLRAPFPAAAQHVRAEGSACSWGECACFSLPHGA